MEISVYDMHQPSNAINSPIKCYFFVEHHFTVQRTAAHISPAEHGHTTTTTTSVSDSQFVTERYYMTLFYAT